jgi:hypothetical protein
MTAGALRVEGYRDLMRTVNRADKTIRRELRKELREGGRIVAEETKQRIGPLSSRSAAGVGVAVRVRGVAVTQRLRKVTGKRPDWGATQMAQGFIPALDAKRDEVEQHLESMLDRLDW